MNRYIAALTIGIGLMAHSPAFAEVLYFGRFKSAPMEECIEASKVGYEVINGEFNDGKTIVREYLVRGLKMGVPWRVYQILYNQIPNSPGRFKIECTYQTGEKK